MKELGRLITAMVTPFDVEGRVDYTQAKRLAVALVESGSEGLVVTGSTGEAPTLTHSEKVQLWREVKEAVGDRAAIIAGAGTYNTRESIELAQEAKHSNVDALLLVVPYYNNPTQEGLYQHFKAIAESTPLPCIPYNVPTRTVVNMTADTTVRLSAVPNIVGIKEASSDFDQIARIIEETGDAFRVWSGNDKDTLGVLGLGGYGVVSVTAHLIGLQVKQLIDLALKGESKSAAQEHRRQLAISKGLFVVSNPIPVKYCLNRAGFNVGGTRLPLTEPDSNTIAFLDELLAKYQVDLPLTIAA
jgi:4-hydroxy-tetrahydrodipicolinate synthase